MIKALYQELTYLTEKIGYFLLNVWKKTRMTTLTSIVPQVMDTVISKEKGKIFI